MIFWDPDPQAFEIPFFKLPVYWYSLFFAAGFFGAYLLTRSAITSLFQTSKDVASIAKEKVSATNYVDKLTLYIFVGTVIGARLGHVLFYDWSYFSTHPEHIIEIPMRGLSSHGGTIGILLSIFFFQKQTKNRLPLTKLLDCLAAPIAFAAGCIRIGNFFNQEILGTQTSLPWGVYFGHPMEQVLLPCHPTQLYEAVCYFSISVLLFKLKGKYKDGTAIGLLLILVFFSRFLIEFLKLPQGDFDQSIHMGQLLSLPFIALGAYFIFQGEKSR